MPKLRRSSEKNRLRIREKRSEIGKRADSHEYQKGENSRFYTDFVNVEEHSSGIAYSRKRKYWDNIHPKAMVTRSSGSNFLAIPR